MVVSWRPGQRTRMRSSQSGQQASLTLSPLICTSAASSKFPYQKAQKWDESPSLLSRGCLPFTDVWRGPSSRWVGLVLRKRLLISSWSLGTTNAYRPWGSSELPAGVLGGHISKEDRKEFPLSSPEQGERAWNFHPITCTAGLCPAAYSLSRISLCAHRALSDPKTPFFPP